MRIFYCPGHIIRGKLYPGKLVIWGVLKTKNRRRKRKWLNCWYPTGGEGGPPGPAQCSEWLQPGHPHAGYGDMEQMCPLGWAAPAQLLQSSTFSQWCWLAAGRTEKLNSCWIPPCAAAQIWVFKDLCDFRGHGSLWKCTKTVNLSQLWKSWDKSKTIKYEEHLFS